MRFDAIQREPFFQAIARPLEVPLEPRFQLRFRFLFLALEALDEPVHRLPVAGRELSLGRREPAEEDFGVAAGIRFARHAPQPSQARRRHAPLERRLHRAQPAPDPAQRDPEIMQRLAVPGGRQALPLPRQVLDQRKGNESGRPCRRVVEDRGVERHRRVSPQDRATARASGARAGARNRRPPGHRCAGGRRHPS